MNSAIAKEAQEARLSRRIGEIKKKNVELLRRHQLAEEDKRLAEQLGCSVTIKTQQTFAPMKGEILRAIEDKMEREAKQQKSETISEKIDKSKVEHSVRKDDKIDKSKVEFSVKKDYVPRCNPSCRFLTDEHREGPRDPDRDRKISRSHPWNLERSSLREVPEKVCDPNEKMTNRSQMKTVDVAVHSAGKERERRELVDWRKEREKIDRQRLERQKDKDGNWKREWDRDKDDLSYPNLQNKSGFFPNRQQVRSVSHTGSAGGGFIVLR